MSSEDVVAVHELSVAAFEDLGRRLHEDPHPPPELESSLVRINHLIDTDPSGAWVAEDDGRVVGAALALVREGLWGLSLLVVDPARQSEGIGRALLARSLEHGTARCAAG
jgi:GNAT superfamily N-acetyltransferase